MSEIASRVKAIIVDKLGVDEKQVTDKALTLLSSSWNSKRNSASPSPMTRQKASRLSATLLLTSRQTSNIAQASPL